MADFDIDSVTRMLGREPDQEINGLHYEAVDRAVKASGLSTEELGRLADTPEIHDLVDQRHEALSMNQATVDRFWQVEGDATDVDHANDAMRDSAERLERIEYSIDIIAASETGNPDAGERLMGFVDRGRPLVEQAGSQELRGMLHLNHALEAGQEQAEARLPRGQEPSAELRSESEEHLAAAKQALAQRPDAAGVIVIVQDLAAHPHPLGRVGTRESKDVYEWHPEGDFSISSDGGVPVVRYQSGEWTTVVSIEDIELVNLVKGEQTYATGISVPTARFLIEADLIRQASQPGLSTSTAPEGLSQELADLIELIYGWACNDFWAGGVDVRVAYLDGVPYVWVGGACIIRLFEGDVGIVELARPCGQVWREVLWSNFVFPLEEEDGLVLNEVNRQRRAHAAASSSPVEAP